MTATSIAAVRGRRVWDSRGRPTVEAEAVLSEIDARMARGAVEYEIAKVRETLLEPLETLDPADLGKPQPPRTPSTDTLSYLDQLSYRRIVGRAVRIASIGPRPMNRAVINHLIDEGP